MSVEVARQHIAELRAELVARSVRPAAEKAWGAMHEATRLLLVSMCTDRDAKAAGVMPWRAFTDRERDAIGAAARQMARDLAAAQALR